MKDNEQNNNAEVIINRWSDMYPPADEETMYVIALTSYEIAEILNDFTEVNPGDITRILLERGYKLQRTGEGTMKWLIKREVKNEQ